MDKITKEDFSKLVDDTYKQLGIRSDNIKMRKTPNKGMLNRKIGVSYSSDRADGYIPQRIYTKLQSKKN